MGYAGAGGASCEVYTPIYHGAFVWRHIALDSGLALQDSPPCSSSVLTNEGVTVVGHQLRAFQGRIYAGWRTVHVGQLRAPALRSARTWRSRTVRYPAPPSSQTKKRRSLVTSYARFFRDTDIRPMTDCPRGTKFRAPALISNPGLALQDSSPSSSSVLANEGATVVGHQLRAFQGRIIYAGWRTVHVGQFRAPALRSARVWRSRTVLHPALPSSQNEGAAVVDHQLFRNGGAGWRTVHVGQL